MDPQSETQVPRGQNKHWVEIVDLWQIAVNVAKSKQQSDLWPILGFLFRANDLIQAVACLAEKQLWVEATILGRSLLEIEIVVKWLLHKDQSTRMKSFSNGIDGEKRRLLRKMKDGVSVTAQILGDVFEAKLKEELTGKNELDTWPPTSIRDMAREVDMERNYDIPYWIQSIYSHASPLSILECQPAKIKSFLVDLFDKGPNGMVPRIMNTAIPAASLHLLSTINVALHLDLSDRIEKVWELIRREMNGEEESNYISNSSLAVPQGDIVLVGADGSHIRYSPKRKKK